MTTDTHTEIAPYATHAGDARHAQVRAITGSAALVFAAVVFVLAVVDRSYGLPFMPMSWYTNRALWYLLAFGSLLGAVFLLRSAGSEASGDAAIHAEGTPVFESLTFYTRRGCHLCDDALAVLKRFRQYLPSMEIIDIDAQPSLRERFDTCVPVVEIDGKVRFRGRVNPVLLQRMIDVELDKSGTRKAESGERESED